jgi:RES domain-containing protein
MDPDEVLSGAGTVALGGRFAPVGTLAVYLSATDSGTGTELSARKARLGGSPQITIDDRCLIPDALDTSMAVAAELIAARVQALIFPSVVGGADNLVVYLANCDPGALEIHNANELISKAKRIAAKVRPSRWPSGRCGIQVDYRFQPLQLCAGSLGCGELAIYITRLNISRYREE